MTKWDLYFASLAGWLLHPGYVRDADLRPRLDQLAELADDMLEHSNGRLDSCRHCGREFTRRPPGEEINIEPS